MTLHIYKKGIEQPRRKPKKPGDTGIEWTGYTWNPFVGCTIHTAGCTNCYAMKTAAWLEAFGSEVYAGTTKKVNGKPVWTGLIKSGSENSWNKPLTIKKQAMIFVNSMSDFFHEAALDEWRIRAIKIMEATPHQYQILTKRPEEILPFLERTKVSFPANGWIGATVERGDFKHRIDTLREVPTQTRFLSLEPLIGPMGDLDLTGIHWVIAGGESGKDVRPMKADWVREIRDACIDQVVPFFFKQWGKPQNNPLYHQAPPGVSGAKWVKKHDPDGKGGKKLDGVRWHEYPAFHLPE